MKKNHDVGKKLFDFSHLQTVFFFGLIIVLSVGMVYLFAPFFYPLFWAAVLAVLFYSWYKYFLSHVLSRNVAAIFATSAVFLVLILPLLLVFLLLLQESLHLFRILDSSDVSFDTLAAWFTQSSFAQYFEGFHTQWTTYAKEAGVYVSQLLFDVVRSITHNTILFVVKLVFTLYTLFFFFKDGPEIIHRLTRLSPLADGYDSKLFERFHATVHAAIKSTLLIGGIQGVLGAILFYATGVPGALLWGVLMAFLGAIPAAGSFIIWVPVGLIMLLVGNIWQGITILAVGACLISLVDNMLRPYLVGKDVALHPVVVLFSTIGGISLFGISGFVIGPVIASLYFALLSVYDEFYKKELKNNR